ncbi:MAG: 3-deoxy-7-phosphoheptulonate synthase [Bacillota bacterium]|nr:3-deoxy-7-phosphoheptulonate synthase [Bacillota bacterium]
MIIIMKPSATKENVDRVCNVLNEYDMGVHLSQGNELTIIGIIGNKNKIQHIAFELMDGVDRVVHVAESYKLANRAFHPEPTVIDLGDVTIGGDSVVVMAGPCAIENQDMVMDTAKFVKSCGAQILRGGAYKPRTSPYSFQGLEVDGLNYMYNAKKAAGLKMVTEVIDEESLENTLEYADILQIGARNMQNFKLLRAAGRTNKPVLLKRGLSATIDELLNAAEYIMAEGNQNVMLCERGIRTFETATRNTLDLSAVPLLKHKSHLPVIVDPSHGTGKSNLVGAMAKAAVVAGADGLIIEVHPTPEKAMSDGDQSLNFKQFEALMRDLKACAAISGRTL